MAHALAEKLMANHNQQVHQDAEPVAGSQQKPSLMSKGVAPAAVELSDECVEGVQESANSMLICLKAGCGKQYGGNQAKAHLSDHLQKVCIPHSGPLLPHQKDVLQKYDAISP